MQPRRDMSLAGELYLIAHDDRTGKPRLHQGATDVILAAGLLAELLYLDCIRIQGKRLTTVDAQPPADPVSRDLWAMLWREQHPVRTWLEFIAMTAKDSVVWRLHQAGVLKPETKKRLLKTVTVWTTTDPNIGAMSWARLSVLLRNHERLSQFDTALSGLVHSGELDRVLLDGASRDTHDHLQNIVDHIWRPLGDLLAEARALIGSDVLGHRI